MRQRLWLRLLVVVAPVLITSCETVDPTKAREVPTYEVVGGALEQSSAIELLAALKVDLGGHTIDEFLSEAGALLFVDAERFQALPLNQGQEGVVSPEGDGEYNEFFLDLPAIQKLPAPPVEDTSISTVEAALTAAKLHPGLFYLEGQEAETTVLTGHSRFELLAKDMSPVAAVDLDTHVAFELALAADTGFLDLVGQGASLKVVMGAEGAVLVHYELLQLEPGPQMTVISEEAAISACTDQYERGAATSAVVRPQQAAALDVTAELIYYAPPLETKVATVYPYYQCGGSKEFEGGSEIVELRTTFVKANQGTPDIMTPPTGKPPVRATDASVVEPSAFGVHDAGTEWVGESAGLSGSRLNAGRFFDTFDAVAGVDARFNWGDGNAWERDFKDPVLSGGDDSNWADNVDIAFYTGHASGNGFTFTSTVDDGLLHYDDARWGNHDLEWLVIAACGPLQASSGGLSWAQRWGSSFHGLHLLLAYANVSQDNETEGRIFARAILGVGESPKTIRAAWVKAATAVQPSDVTYAVMGVGNGDGMVNWSDYFWGRGAGGGPDISSGEITYYWKLSGPS